MSAENFFQTVRGARDRRPIGFYGQFDRHIPSFESLTAINTDPQAEQVDTISIPGSPDSSTEYSVTVDGVTASFTTDSSATQDELGEGLEAAINAEAGIRGKLTASYTGGTLTLTGEWPGVSFTTTASGGTGGGSIGTPSTSISADEADPVDFGRVVVETGEVDGDGVPTCAVATTSQFSAQVMTFTVATGASATFTPILKINGKEYVGDAINHDTDAATTADAIKDEFNAIAPANTVLATTNTADVVLTAEVDGAEFEASIIAAGDAAGTVDKAYTTGPSVATSLRRAMLGISVRREDVENETVNGDDPSYAGNTGVEVATRGKGVVQRDTSETWNRGDEVFVSLASATAGRLYNSAGSDRVWLGRSPISIVRSEPSSTSDGLGRISIAMGA